MTASEATSGTVRTWTGPQLQAIKQGAGDLLVSAAAGSGKTAVLAERCARLVCGGDGTGGGRCGIENLLVVTFTEAAATEMRTRIAATILEKTRNAKRETRKGDADEEFRWLRRQSAMVERASISTLHGFCYRVLKQYFHEAGIDPGFEVIEQEEAEMLREEVLEELFAGWYRMPADGPAGGSAPWQAGFGDFFEDYAQGRESNCREMVLKLHNMLASTADRTQYLEIARRVYREVAGCGGAEETMEQYAKVTLAEKLRVAGITANRACMEVAGYPGTEKMLAGLQEALERIENARRLLESDGIKAWARVGELLSRKWPTLKSIKEIDSFDDLKRRTWEDVKEMIAKLHDAFKPDPAQMLNDLRRIGRVVTEKEESGPLETLIGMAEEFDRAYSAAKREQNRVDFNDLERLTLELFRKPGGQAASELRRRFRHVLVDEFQDINPLQHALLDAVRSPEEGGNWFLVGDVKQSIYGFRLAEPGLFLRLEQTWMGVEGKYLALPHNFRSRAGLLEVMNGVFGRLMTPEVVGVDYFPGHALVAGIAEQTGDGLDIEATSAAPAEVHLIVLDHEEEEEEQQDHADSKPPERMSPVEQEGRMAAELIERMVKEGRLVRDMKDGRLRAAEYRDIAILLRSVKNKALLFSRALDERGIPVHADLSSGYFDTPEICDAIALLQVLDNPKQDIPLATVMLGPYGGFTHDDLALVRLTYARRDVPFAEAAARYGGKRETRNVERGTRSMGNVEAGVEEIAADAPPFSEALAARLAELFAKLARWRDQLAARPLHEGLADIYAESRIFAYVSGLDARGGGGAVGGGQRIANLRMLHQRALQFAGFRKQGLHRFLRFIEKLRGREGDFGEAPVLSEASDVVRIMSVHKSKGLEFPVVLVSGLGGKLHLSEGGFGGGAVQVHRSLGIGMMAVDAERNVIYPTAASARIVDAEERSKRAEELRLLYVAMTRARDHLLLTGHVGKAAKVEAWREQWRGHAGPLPEDVILKGRSPLDWVLPALACDGAAGSPGALRVNWGDARQGGDQVVVTLHAAAAGAEATPPAVIDAEREKRIQRILAREPLERAAARNEEANEKITRMIARVTGEYAHAELSREPAVRTVTYLKTVGRTEEGMAEASPPPEIADIADAREADPALAEQARVRGIATHRILELLDFTQCASASAVDEQIARMIEARALTLEESASADRAGILWFLHHSACGARIIAAAKRGAGDPSIRLRREIPFTWSAPLSRAARPPSTDPADWPTIRGVMDLLLVDTKARTAELLDYKTDSAHLWKLRLPDYERQMTYYLQAAGEILGYPVDRATLVFLAARVEHEVLGG